MKRIFFALLALGVVLVSPNIASAQDATATDSGLNVFDAPNSDSFRQLNPLQIAESPLAETFVSPAALVNRVLIFLFPLAGLILFVMLVWGGLSILVNAHSSSALKAGRERITAALLGFFILFASFWIIQIVEFVFGLSIL